MNIKTTASPKTKPDFSKLGFGKYFSDHLLLMNYTAGKGWHDMRIEPYADFSLNPAAMVLHYGQAIFEGLKAYKDEKGGVRLFRPRDNFARMNRSAARLCMPELDIDTVMDGLTALLKLEQDWIPTLPGTALYIRPTMISTEAMLGVKASSTYLFFIILSPVGAYYAGGFAPTSLYIEDQYTRASMGGTGEAKCAGNYAASLIASQKAKELGFDQALWLDAKERKYIEEVGSMNIFFVLNGEVLTSGLDGTILPGITRDSVLKVLRAKGIKVTERKVSLDELFDGMVSGTLTEAFGSGTAAVISPVGRISYKGKDYPIGSGVGQITQMLYDEITGIQNGVKPDPFNWMVTVS